MSKLKYTKEYITDGNKFYWNEDTIEYFKNRNKPGCEGQYYREVWDFVKNECSLEDGETYEMLANDLLRQTQTQLTWKR